MKYSLLILIAFIMNACYMAPATEEDINDMSNKTLGSKNAWSSSAKLHADGKSRGTLQAHFEHAPGDYVLQFNIDAPITPGSRLACVADITWSVEGNHVSRTVSIGNGTRVSGSGQAIHVVMRDTSDGLSPTTEYTVSALLTPGTRPSINQPPVFAPAGANQQTTTAQPTAVFDIPQGIGVISYYVTYLGTTAGVQVVLTEAQLSVEEVDPAGNALKFFSPVATKGFIPLAPGATKLQFDQSNMAAASAINLQVTWGIEG